MATQNKDPRYHADSLRVVLALERGDLSETEADKKLETIEHEFEEREARRREHEIHA